MTSFGINQDKIIAAIAEDHSCLPAITAGLFSEKQRAIAIEANPVLLLETMPATSPEFKNIVMTAAQKNPRIFLTLPLDKINDAILIDALQANEKHIAAWQKFPLTSWSEPEALYHVLRARAEKDESEAIRSRLTRLFAENDQCLSALAIYRPSVLADKNNKVPHFTTNNRGFMAVVARQNLETLNHLGPQLKQDRAFFTELAKIHGTGVYYYADQSIDPRCASWIRSHA
jgi:hypothetical protein